MDGSLLSFFLVGVLFGSICVVWLVASFFPVDERRLPAILRLMRTPVSRLNAPGIQIAVPFRTRSAENMSVYRIVIGLLLLLTQTMQLRPATDAQMKAELGWTPLAEACLAWLVMLLWIGYVVWAFRQAGRRA